jgi:lysozyme
MSVLHSRLIQAGFAVSLGLSFAIVGHFEGRKNTTYTDIAGTPTICDGHTGADVKLGQVLTDAQCDELREEDVAIAMTAVNRLVKVPMTDERRAALTSFTLNLGQGTLARSDLLKKLNAGDTWGACTAMADFDKATVTVKGKRVKKAVKGLTIRRAKERELCEIGLEKPWKNEGWDNGL